MELSEEEKEAIERLTFYRDQIKEELYPRIDYEEEKAIGIVLNLLEKQQKEIEELKAINQIQKYRIEVIDEREFISKDKIREVLKDLDEFDDYFFNVSTLKEATKNSLKQLLEEN